MPEKFIVDDSLVIRSPAGGPEVEVYRGPNIGDPPVSEPLAESLSGVVAIKLGDKVTTDHIMPAGARMKYRSNVPKYSEFVFESVDSTFPSRAAENRDKGLANFIVAGLSYGQGSSREHAAICPMYLGVKLVAAKSIERIHRSNLINFGIVPAVFVDENDYDRIEQGASVEVADLAGRIAEGERLVMKNSRTGAEIELKCELGPKERDILIAGGVLNHMKHGARRPAG
jgi:aconitate hydratase